MGEQKNISTTNIAAEETDQADKYTRIRKKIDKTLDQVQQEKIVDELYEIVKLHMDTVTQRGSVINSKATSVLTVIGVSVVVAFTFGGSLLLKHRSTLEVILRGLYTPTTVLYLITVIVGVWAGIIALKGMLIRGGYRRISTDSVFKNNILLGFDQDVGNGLKKLKQYLIVHLVSISNQNYDVHTKRAATVKRAQKFYQWFLVLLLCNIIILTIASWFPKTASVSPSSDKSGAVIIPDSGGKTSDVQAK